MNIRMLATASFFVFSGAIAFAAEPSSGADAKGPTTQSGSQAKDETSATYAAAQDTKTLSLKDLLTPPVLKRRWVPDKSDGVEIDPETSIAGLFVLKFVEGSHIRLTPSGFAVDRSNLQYNNEELARLKRAGLDIETAAAQAQAVNEIIASRGFEAENIFRAPGFRNGADSQFIDDQFADKSELEQRSGEELADLDLYYAIHQKGYRDYEGQKALMEKLASLSVVEQVYAAVLTEGAQAATPNITSQQTYLDAAPQGVEARSAWARPGGLGDGVRFVDVEFDWATDHEDFPSAANSFFGGRPTCAYDGNGTEHGTAVLGVVAAPHNGFGVNGVAPNVRWGLSSTCRPAHWIFGFVFSLFTGDEVTGRTSNISVAAAIGEASFHFVGGPRMQAGDVLLVEQHAAGPTAASCPIGYCGFEGRTGCAQWGYVAMEHFAESFDAIRRATAAGVIVVEAAGNGGQNLDMERYRGRFSTFLRHSGALLVGASSMGDRAPACFSNSSQRVDVHSWGAGVVTTGYNNGATAPSPFTSDRPIRRFYTQTFSGTSSASAIVAGVTASLQGARRASGQPPLSPIEVERLFKSTGSRQVGTMAEIESRPIGPQPNLRAATDRAVAPGGGFTGDGLYRIRSKLSGKVLDVDVSWFRGQDNGQRLVQWDSHNGENQMFFLSGDGSGAFAMVPRHSRKLIDIGAASLADGADVVQWQDTGGRNQRFRIEPAGGGFYRIVADHSGKVLEVFDWRRDNGARITQWTWHGGDNQLWEFIPIR